MEKFDFNKAHEDAVIIKERTQELSDLIKTYVQNYSEKIIQGEIVSPGISSRFSSALFDCAKEMDIKNIRLICQIIEELNHAKILFEEADL